MDTVFTTHNYVGVSAKPLFVTDVSVVKATPYVFRGFALALHSRLLSFFCFLYYTGCLKNGAQSLKGLNYLKS
jgi:hypothetical protein